MKYSFNENFFDSPLSWKEEQAYWLGWLVADGYNNGEQVSLSLQEKDRCVVENLKKTLQYNGPLILIKRKPESIFGKPKKQYQNRYALILSRKTFAKKLEELGLNNQKGRYYNFPVFLKQELYPHFLRGLFEGDGTFSFSKYNQFEINLISTNNVLLKIKEILYNININCQIKDKTFKNGQGILRFCGVNFGIKLFNYLYSDCTLYLPRKLESFIKLLEYKNNKIKKDDNQYNINIFRKNLLKLI